MFDITQINRSLFTPTVTEINTQGLRAADSTLALTCTTPPPVVTWRVTRNCNLNCLNCLSASRPHREETEISTREGMALISDLADYRVRRLVLAGGEPLLRADLTALIAFADRRGIQPSLLTNGTLLTLANATRLKHAGLRSVSILLEGIGRQVDRHRGVRGAYNAILEGYANCEAAKLPAEIRMPLTRWNYPKLGEFLNLAERWQIHKVVFAHMVYAGRGNRPEDDLSPEEKRRAVDLILDRAEDFYRRGVNIQIATDENHADAIYFYLRLARKNPRRAVAALRWLRRGGAHVQGAGIGIAAIDSIGEVHPDPYWHNYSLGNVRRSPFREIWDKPSDPLLRGLRHRLPLLKGQCGNCRWRETCGGNLRVRAEQFYGNPWMTDPACYLSNDEIRKEAAPPLAAMEDNVLLSEQAA